MCNFNLINSKITVWNLFEINQTMKKSKKWTSVHFFCIWFSLSSEEKKEVIKEAKEILDVEDVIASIVLVEDLRIQKN